MITKTQIVVLKSIDYSESSQITTVLSLEHGKVALIAKGSRKPKSKFAGMLQPGRILDVIYYYKPSRSVQTLSEASYSCRLDTLGTHLDKMAVSMRFLELVSQIIHDNEVNEPVFRFSKNVLAWIHNQNQVSPSVFPYLQVRLAELSGLGIQLDLPDEAPVSGYLNIDAGTISVGAESTHSVKLTEHQLQFLIKTVSSRQASVLDFPLPGNELKILVDYLDSYLRYHVEGMRPRRSDAIFEQILSD